MHLRPETLLLLLLLLLLLVVSLNSRRVCGHQPPRPGRDAVAVLLLRVVGSVPACKLRRGRKFQTAFFFRIDI